jgi:hypothetical protein
MHFSSKNLLVTVILLSATMWLGTSNIVSLAQQPSRQDRLRAIDWFVINFVVPKQTCTLVGGEALDNFNKALTAVRKEYLKAFELVESTKEYSATLVALRIADADRFSGPNGQVQAFEECKQKTFQIASDLQLRRHDKAFEYLVGLFSSPT